MSVAFDTQPTGFFSRIAQTLLGGFSKKPIKRLIVEMTLRLKDQKSRLEEVVRRLRDRYSELFQLAVKAYSKNDVAKATIYANEAAEVKKIVKNVISAILALEQVIIRLETIRELGDIGVTLSLAVPILETLRGQINNVVPEVAVELENLVIQARNIVTSTTSPPSKEPTVEVVDNEAKKILKEVKALAELKVKELFPEIPKSLSKPSESKGEKQSKVLEIKLSSKKIDLNALETKLIDYIVSHGGFLDVEEASNKLNVSKDEILLAIDNLKKKKKIVIKSDK